jgi:cytochrome P450
MSIPDLRARWTGGGAPDNPTLTRVTSFAAARRVLRTRTARQAGFTAERTREVSFIERLPVLFLEGEQHRDIRRSTARYFTPRHVARYDELMTQLAGSLVAGIDSRRDTRLADLTLVMAVRVAAQVLGLTDSRVPGLERRVERFSHAGDGAPRSSGSMSPLRQVRQRAVVGAFLALDVAPAVKARREHPRDDLSHAYLTAPDEQRRFDLLHEILRLDPVVGTVYRELGEPVEVAGRIVAQGSLLAIDIAAANVDPAVFGADADRLCPHREVPKGVSHQGLSFGDGHHRCPGEFLAIRETDVFLRALFAVPGLRLVGTPRIGVNETVKGYEVRGLRVRAG